MAPADMHTDAHPENCESDMKMHIWNPSPWKEQAEKSEPKVTLSFMMMLRLAWATGDLAVLWSELWVSGTID